MRKLTLLLAWTLLLCATNAIAQKINSVDEINSISVYTIVPKDSGRGALSAGASDTYLESNKNIDDTNVAQHFMFIEKEGKTYLYCVGANKYVNDEGQFLNLTEEPNHHVVIEKDEQTGLFLLKVNGNDFINVSWGYAHGTVANWNTIDDGNRFTITKISNNYLISNGIRYKITDLTNNKISVVGNYTDNVVIPEKITYNGTTYSVTSIDPNAFNGSSTLKSIEIPNSVTAIGEDAFADCSALTEVHIKDLAAWCNIDFANGNANPTNVAHNLYLNGELITELVIPNDVTVIKNHAFRGCSNITSVTMHDGVTALGQYAFNTCTSLTSAKLSGGITVVPRGLFSGCTNLREVVIPDGIETIEPSSFYLCALTSITIPNSVTSIGENAFEYCSGLKTVRNLSNLTFSKGSSSNGNIAYYADNVYNVSNGSIEGDYIFGKPNNVNTLVCYLGNETELTLPADYKGESYAIGESAFEGNNTITSITIPNSVTSIGNYAFQDCSGLTSITIPNSVTSIGNKAFNGCYNLHSVTIGSGILTIGNQAFNNPDKVIWQANTPPEGYTNAKGRVNYVSNDRFTNLTNVYIYPYLSSKLEIDGIIYVLNPSERTCDVIDCAYNNSADTIKISETLSYMNRDFTVKTIMPYAFYGNSHIKEVEISNNGDIKEQAFCNCKNLKTANISNKGYIADFAFFGCSSLTSVKMSNISKIDICAFYDCSNLPNIVIPNSVKSIGSQCFQGCTVLNSITLGDSVTTIGESAFQNCSLLPEITIPASVTTIANNVFKGCSKLADVIITNRTSTLSLGSNGSSPLFADCPLDSVYIGGNITYNTSSSYGYSPFYDNKSLRTIVLGENVTNIYKREFDGCSALKKITLGNGITEISNYAFSQCTSLPSIVIPNSVTSLGSFCFLGCNMLNSVTLGKNLKTINSYAFQDCTSLPNIIIPNSVETIGSYSFKGCTALNHVTLGENVRTINDNAFENCSSLAEITIPASVTTIANNVFKGCSKLADVIISSRRNTLSLGSNGSSPLFADCPLDSVYIGGNITYNTSSSYGYSPFYRNTSLRSVAVSDYATQVFTNEFYGCTGLTDVIVGHKVKSIGDYAFSACSSLNAFTFGSSIEEIGKEAFSDCTKLTSITSCATIPPVCGAQALEDINIIMCSLYVPIGYAEAYQQAEQWKNFLFVEDLINIYTLKFVVEGEVYDSIILPFNAKILTPEAPIKEGYTFNGWINTPETMPNEDVTIEGTYTINNYALTYKINDTEVTDTLTYGDKIVLPEGPAKEGYTFDGWFLPEEDSHNVINKDNAGEKLYSNAPCQQNNSDKFTSWDVLFDGDPATIFHSEYSGNNSADGLDHYIRVDMGTGKEIDYFTFTFSTRKNNTAYTPTTIVVEGSNNANGTYTQIATLTDLPIEHSATYNSNILGNGNKYRYIRFRVTETNYNDMKGGHPFFYISEFNMKRKSSVPQTMPAEDLIIEGRYTANSYNVTYMVAGTVYAIKAVEYGAKIPLIEIPETESYTFNNWENVPETMPAEDIVINANINANSYNVTYIIDGKIEETIPVEFGTKIPILQNSKNLIWENAINIKDNADAMLYTNAKCTTTTWGDEFTSWTVLFDDNTNTIFHSEYGNKQTPDGLDHYIRVDMGEGKNINKFRFTYTTRNLENNNNVSPKRIVVEGSNSANGSYTTIATLENLPSAKETVYTSEVMGSENTAYRYIRYRVIETHGNSKDNGHPYFAIAEFGMTSIEEVPASMPARDIIITGNACTDIHTITYIVDGKTYKTETVGCYAVITPLEAPVKEGYIFSGWSEIPEIMPAEDITITGSFALDNTTAIDEVRGNSDIVVYDLNGNRILDTENLERGVYIINGIKVPVK